MISVRFIACSQLLCCVIALACSISSYAEQNFQFRRLFNSGHRDSGERLNTIYKTIQDKQGFIWFASKRGLIRYDGKRLKKYLHQTNKSFSSPALVYDLALDNNDQLWVASDRGISRYQPETNSFQHPLINPATQTKEIVVHSIAIDTNNRIFAGTSRGLYASNTKNNAFSRLPLNETLQDTHINVLFIDSQNTLWAGSKKQGVFQLNPDSSVKQHYHVDASTPYKIRGNSIVSVTEDAESNIWISILGKGLERRAVNTSQFKAVKYLGKQNKIAVEGLEFHRIFNDSKNNLWFGTNDRGIFFVDGITSETKQVTHSSDNGNSLTSNSILDIYEDKDGNFWLSSFPYGVNYLNNEVWKFRNYRANKTSTNSLPNSTILSIFSDKTHLWIGTEGGLASLNKSTGNFTQFTKENTKGSLHANAILDIEKDASGDLWIGTWSGGLHRFSPKTGEFKHYPISADIYKKRGEFIWDILRTQNDDIWVGTQEHGLAHYHKESDSFKVLPPKAHPHGKNHNNHIWSLLEDSQHNLWVGTSKGLWRYKPNEQSFDYFFADNKVNTLSGNKISALYEDQQGHIWIGKHDEGIDIYKPKSKQFIKPHFNDLLPSQNIASIVQDLKGDMWLGTSEGLTRVANDFYKQRIFLQDDGLAGDSFIRNNFTQDASGRIIVGSTNGLSIFDPEHFDSPTLLPKTPLITELLINEKVVQVDQAGPLKRAINYTKNLELAEENTVISLEISPLNYRSQKEDRHFYKLDGYDEQWKAFNQNLSVTYTNLPAGNYTFHVKARKLIADIDSNKTSLTIRIQPSIWQTPLAYSIYLSLCLLGFIVLYYFLYKVRLQKKDVTHQHQYLQFDQIKESYLINKAESLEQPSSRMAELVNTLLNETENHDTCFQTEANSSDTCILIVDDNVTNRMITRSILNLEKYQVYEAANAAEALEFFEHKIDISMVLLSMTMSDMPANYICKQIRNYDCAKTLPIIFLCDQAEEQALLACYLAGGNDFILRPAMKKEVLARVKLLLLLRQGQLKQHKTPTVIPPKAAIQHEDSLEEIN